MHFFRVMFFIYNLIFICILCLGRLLLPVILIVEDELSIISCINSLETLYQKLENKYCINTYQNRTLSNAIFLSMLDRSKIKVSAERCEVQVGIRYYTYKQLHRKEEKEKKSKYKKITIDIAMKICLAVADEPEIAKDFVFSTGFFSDPCVSITYKKVCIDILETYCKKRNMLFDDKVDAANNILGQNNLPQLKENIEE